jgi:hypothetical protein
VAACTDSRRGLGTIGMARDWTLVARETSSRLAPVAISLTRGPARANAGPSPAKLSAFATRTQGCRPPPLKSLRADPARLGEFLPRPLNALMWPIASRV